MLLVHDDLLVTSNSYDEISFRLEIRRRRRRVVHFVVHDEFGWEHS